jgi:hypothetical protein
MLGDVFSRACAGHLGDRAHGPDHRSRKPPDKAPGCAEQRSRVGR